jgi:hypothetical protein
MLQTPMDLSLKEKNGVFVAKTFLRIAKNQPFVFLGL